VADAVVYGVIVPGADGRAGMAAIVTTNEFDFIAFRQHLVKSLPEYARPLFVRIRSQLEMTATFKPKKQTLVSQGYNPALVLDDIYIDDRASQIFVKLGAALYERIMNREVRL
jgi:fatty-acyl-CoA synthase